jgi:hypothetical protein
VRFTASGTLLHLISYEPDRVVAGPFKKVIGSQSRTTGTRPLDSEIVPADGHGDRLWATRNIRTVVTARFEMNQDETFAASDRFNIGATSCGLLPGRKSLSLVTISS